MEHFFMPDSQCKPGLTYKHMTGAGNYVADKKPDVIINAGDHFDMPSLSSYDKGTLRAEGCRYQDDIDAGREGMHAFMKPIDDLRRKQKRSKTKLYTPRFVFLIGNHEERIMRHVQANPHLHNKLSYKDFGLDEWGWEVHDFLEFVVIDGVHYAHYWYLPNSGNPYTSQLETRLRQLGFSFTMGHQQGLRTAIISLNNGETRRGLAAGSFYQHDEHYKGPQANRHWRGCIYKHEVHEGNYDIMELSLRYLLSEWT